MPSHRGQTPPTYRRLPRSELGAVESLDIGSEQVSRFIGTVAEILGAVRRGPAHSLVMIEVSGEPVGFYGIHPDPRDAACWWLGWLAIVPGHQGRGHGRSVLPDAIARLVRIPGCRRLRLLVAPDNFGARRLYDRAGFSVVGRLASSGELVMELEVGPEPEAWSLALARGCLASRRERARRRLRLRPSPGPHAARVIGVERGPPAISRVPASA